MNEMPLLQPDPELTTSKIRRWWERVVVWLNCKTGYHDCRQPGDERDGVDPREITMRDFGRYCRHCGKESKLWKEARAFWEGK